MNGLSKMVREKEKKEKGKREREEEVKKTEGKRKIGVKVCVKDIGYQ